MKSLYILLISCLLIGMTGYGQVKEFGVKGAGCGFDNQLNKLTGGSLKNGLDFYDSAMRSYKSKNKTILKSGPQGQNAVIPIVVKVIWGGSTPSNYISDAQIQTQITALNQYYAPVGLRFCLATIDNSGNALAGPVPGIVRSNSATHVDLNLATELATLNAVQPVLPTNEYLTIYIVKSISDPEITGQIKGYGMIPGFSTNFDGIVMRYDAFGNSNDPTCTSCVLAPESDQGKILAHEMGHYLGLFHTFMGGCDELDQPGGDCSVLGDKVCDTPPVKQPNSGCPITAIDSCPGDGLFDDINNYMDYTNEDCLNSFTQGQIANIWMTLNTFRANLITSVNLANAGITCIPTTLLANFTAPTYSTCSGTSLQFTATPINGASYAWNFGDGATGAGQIVSHPFANSAEPVIVTLTVTLSGQSVSFTRPIYIVNCSPINNDETTWYFSRRNKMSFQTGVPVRINFISENQSIHFDESCAVQNNSSGQVLFFTNGTQVYNSQEMLVNQNNLLLGHPSSRNGVLIVPDPANSNEYYIFTKDAKLINTSEPGPNGFTFTKINGTTLALTQLNTAIQQPLGYSTGNNGAILGGEGVTAIQNCNGYWILTLLQKGNQMFIVVYLLDNTGLHYNSETPAVQSTSTLPFAGSLKASPDGNRVILAGYAADYCLYDFDKHNGVFLPNPVLLPLPVANTAPYGACFSPDSQVLYVGYKYFMLYQYNLNSSNIASSAKKIADISGFDMEIGPDNKIYINKGSGEFRLAVIHNPNNVVTPGNPNACNISAEGLETETIGGTSFPNLIKARINTVYSNTISYHANSCLTYRFYANVCGNTFNWNFNDGTTSTEASPLHTFPHAGTFTITVNVSGTLAQVTVTVGGEAPVISGTENLCLSSSPFSTHSVAVDPGQVCQWSITGGAGTFNSSPKQSDVIVNWTSLPGTITITVTDLNGCTHTASQTITQDCSSDSCPSNAVFSLPETSAQAIFNVSDNIVTQGNYTVSAGSDISLYAQNFILIKTDSYIKPNSLFLAKTQSCPSPRPALKSNDEAPALLVAYPNPTDGLLYIEGIKFNEVFVTDLTGKSIFYSKYDSIDAATIDMSALQQGIYFLKVTEPDGNVQTLKIIKD